MPSDKSGVNRAPVGIFHNQKKMGMPANSRLLAVVFVDRLVREEQFFLRMKVFHNPFAKSPLPVDFFKGHSQYVVKHKTKDSVSLENINEGNELQLVN